MKASFKKLKNGNWGISTSDGVPAMGDSVTVTKRSGETSVAVVKRVLWSDSGKSICEIEQPNGNSRRTRESRDGYAASCGYPCPVTGRRCTPSNPCHDCQ